MSETRQVNISIELDAELEQLAAPWLRGPNKASQRVNHACHEYVSLMRQADTRLSAAGAGGMNGDENPALQHKG